MIQMCYTARRDYITMSDETTQQTQIDDLAKFKQNVREWLKSRQISVAELATQIGKSEGTVRNWLYSNLNITEENRKAIADFAEYVNSGAYTPGSVFRAFAKTGFLYVALNGSGLPEDEHVHWCLAAGVAVHTLKMHPTDNQINQEDITFMGTWVAEAVMSRAREILTKVVEGARCSGRRFPIEKYMTEKYLNPLSLMSIDKVDGSIYSEDDGTRCVPINLTIWKPLYVAAAADCRKESCIEFVVKALHERAIEQNDKNLDDFLYPDTGYDDVPF